MGNWLWQKIAADSGLTDSDTEDYELAKDALISSIMVRAQIRVDDTARDAATVCARLWDDMDKLEVLGDEEDVIKSLSGREVLGLNMYDFHAPPAWQVGEDRDGYNIIDFYLNFGRFPGDLKYLINTGKWGLVKLYVEHSITTTDKLGFKSGDLALEIWQLRRIGDLPEAVLGHFKTSRKHNWTATTTAQEVKKILPCKNPYRRIAIFSHEDSYTPGEAITDITLEVDDGALKPFYGVPMRMLQMQTAMYGITPVLRFTTSAYTGATAALSETEIPYIQSCVLVPRTASGATAQSLASVAGSVIAIAQTGAGDGFALVQGDGFMGCMLIPFDLGGDDRDYYLSGEHSKIEVVVDEKATRVPAMSIVLDELVKT